MDVLVLAREMKTAMEPNARCRPGGEAVGAFWDWLVPYYMNTRRKATREQIASWTEGRPPDAVIPHYDLYVLEDGSILGIPNGEHWAGTPLVPPGEEAPPVPVCRGGFVLVCGGGENSGEAIGDLRLVQ